MIRMNNLQANGWDFTELKHIELADKQLKKYRIEPGDLLFNRTNSKELVGKCEVFQESGDWVFASYLIRVRLDTSRVLPSFVSEFLNCPAGRIQIDQVSRQIAGMTNINAEELKDLQVPLPSIAIQRRILGELESARASRDIANANATALLKSLDGYILNEVAINPNISTKAVLAVRRKDLTGPLTPEPYAVKPLEKAIEGGIELREVGVVVRDRITPTKDLPDDVVDWIRIDDLLNHPLGLSSVRTQAGSDIVGTLIPVSEGDLLIARLGPTILNAKFIQCPSLPRTTVASPEFLVLRANREWNPTFLLWLLRTEFYRKIMYARSRGGTPSRYRLGVGDFEAISIPRTPRCVQNAIAEECRSRVAEAIRLRAHAELAWREARTQFESQLLKGKIL